MVSTGNEADLDCADFIDHLIDQPEVRAIALFAETIRHAPSFAAAARRAIAAAKPIVVLKIGLSEVTARSAQAHTGALVGDDRVFDGVCRQFGIVRVEFDRGPAVHRRRDHPHRRAAAARPGGGVDLRRRVRNRRRSRAGAERADAGAVGRRGRGTARRAAEFRHAAQSAGHHRRRGTAAGSVRAGAAHPGEAAGVLRARLPVRRAGRRGACDRVRADGAAPHRGGTARRRHAGADDQPHGEAGDRGLDTHHRGDRSALRQRRPASRHERAWPCVLVVGAIPAPRAAPSAPIATIADASERPRSERDDARVPGASATCRWCRRRWRATRIRRWRRRVRSADAWC